MNYLQCLNPSRFWFHTITLYNKFTNRQSDLSINLFFGNDFNQHRMGANNSNVVSYSYEFSDNLNRLYQNHNSNFEQSSYPILTMQQMNDSRIGVRAVRKKRGFATFRRKFIRKRKTSKIHDHVRVIRELVSTWNPIEMKMLLDEYESLAALKDLTIQADLARSPATTFKQDLGNLFDSQFCSDVEIIYRGVTFPVHRAILSVRCPYFRDLLAEYPIYGSRICLELETSSVDVNLFSIILKYLYTGDLTQSQTNQDFDFSILRRLNDKFNTPNSLENDLEYLLDYGNFADAVLVFTSENIQNSLKSDSSNSEYGFRSKLELRCHKAILSARSQFFYKIISRRSRQSVADDDHDGCPQCDGTANSIIYHYCNKHNTTIIVLDETVIPKRFARVLLHAIYLDTVDLSLIYQSNEFHESKTHYTTVLNTHTINDDNNINVNSNGNHSSNIQFNLNTNQYRPSLLDEAMELYQIGRFLELDILSQGCEDLIVDWISIDTIVTILQWSAQPYGSDWVHRQAVHFLREEFEIIYQSPVLYQLRKIDLFEILDSDFVQASEFEILQSIIKWSEAELLRQMEEREPNVLSSTSYSVNKKPKKRDINDLELSRILNGLLKLVRAEHIIPHNIDYVAQIVKRRLIGIPSNYRIVIDNNSNNNNNEHEQINTIKINPWIRKKSQSGIFLKRPRLFTPYHDTLKMIYANEQHNLESAMDSYELNQLFYNDVPDALYMVDNGFEFTYDLDELQSHRPNQSHYRRLNFYKNRHNHFFYKYNEENDNDEDANKNTDDYQLSVQNNLGEHYLSDQCLNMLSIPDEKTLNAMLKRLDKLYNTTSCQRALSLRLSFKHEIKLQIKLRVVREFNLPDQIAFILDKHYKKFLNSNSNKLSSNNSKVQTTKNTNSETIDYSKEDLMPDVTIATDSVNQLQIRDQSDTSLNLNNLNADENSTSSFSVNNNSNRFCTSHVNRSASPKYSTFRLNSNSTNN